MKLEISRKSELALAAVQELARHDGPMKGAELAAVLETTPHYLPHVVRPLVVRGWVESNRGPTGGYRLTADLADITFFEFVEVVEGPMEEGRCVLRGKPCPSVDLCVLHEPWLRAREALFEELRRTTLADVQIGKEAA
jgi:Rrf2 family iron-sulfur cluster assembly transcriptional regulator